MDDADRIRCRLVALSLAPGVGAVRIARLLEYFGSVDTVWQVPTAAVLDVRGIGRGAAEAILAARGDDAVRRADAMLSGKHQRRALMLQLARLDELVEVFHPKAWEAIRSAAPWS